MMVRNFLLWLPILLAACGAEPIRYPVPPAETQMRVSVPYAGIEVRDVSLPTYAAGEEISLILPDGTLQADSGILWADDPVRAVTLDLARGLARITGRKVAPEPWPFRSIPDAVVDVRVEELAAEPSGLFRISGQYFVAPDASERAERAAIFDLTVAYDPKGGLPAVARARAEAVVRLAELIARDGMR